MANSDQRAEARQMPDKWWCVQFDRQYGPMSLDELKDKLRDVDTRDVFVWRDGFDDWKRVEDVSEVMPPRPKQPPPFRADKFRADTGKPSKSVQDQKPILNFIRNSFSLRGRLNRAKFWITKILWGIASGITTYFLLISIATADYDASLICFLVLVQMALLWPGVIAVDVKRLHDLNLSGWWIVVIISCSTALVYAAAHLTIELNTLRGMLILYLVLYWVILGGWKGTAGDNKYGPDGAAKGSTGKNRLGPQPIYQPEEIPPLVGNRLSDHNQSTASLKRDTPTKTTEDFLPTPQPSALDLPATHGRGDLPAIYAIIDHEVSQLERQDSVAREDLYEQARRKLFHKLRPDGRWNIQWEWKAYVLEKAIRWVEGKWARADRQRLDDQPPSFASEQMSASTRADSVPTPSGLYKQYWE
jgi:uncharacterized membrane protein YhaH (DUF805 family)